MANDDNKVMNMETIAARDKERQDLIEAVFGGKKTTSSPAPVSGNIGEISETQKIETIQDKHLKIRNEVMNIILEHGYMQNDQNIQAIVGNFMANLSRLRY